MADKAHRLTDEKLEQMEKHLSAVYSDALEGIQKRQMKTASMRWRYMNNG